MPGIRRAEFAAVVEENTVDTIRGQAVSLVALGPVSVVSNRLISRGLVALDLKALVRSGASKGVENVLSHLSSLVAIVNLGSPAAPSGAVNLNTGASRAATHGALGEVSPGAASGNVLFDDNRCLLDLARVPSGLGPALPGNLLLPAILILSMDDVGFQFKETPGKALFSAMTFGQMNMTVHNQANHCLKVVGAPPLVQIQPNHILQRHRPFRVLPGAASRRRRAARHVPLRTLRQSKDSPPSPPRGM
jgi:hypothetical protein